MVLKLKEGCLDFVVAIAFAAAVIYEVGGLPSVIAIAVILVLLAAF